jgi:hypothetical protein
MPSNAYIADVLSSYERSVQSGFCVPPIAPYVEGSNAVLPKVSLNEGESTIAVAEDGTLYTWNGKGEYWIKSMAYDNIWKQIESRSEIQSIREGRYVAICKLGYDTAYHLLKLFSDRYI